MADTGAIVDVLHAIGERVSDDMSEQDVQNAFLNENFFETLDYEGAGFDLRSEFSLRIRETLDHDARTSRFPEAYLGGFSSELEYIDYEWQTRRYPVNAEIQTRTDGTFAVEAGRSDSITDPRMDSEERARYVHAAVNGRNVKSGEEMSIPIPRRDADVQALLSEWDDDRATVEETDIEALEAEIDRVVYDLFDLTDDEREVVEAYLEVF